MTAVLPIPPVELGRPRVSPHWCRTRDGDPQALALFRRHYSCTKPAGVLRGNAARFAGQGEPLVLISTDGDALCVWRRERFRLDGQQGVCCSVFRNEGSVRSSDLLREAMEVAWERWPGERLFTHVDARKVRSSNPGYCFLCAGWRRLPERTKARGLVILEALPTAPTSAREARGS